MQILKMRTEPPSLSYKLGYDNPLPSANNMGCNQIPCQDASASFQFPMAVVVSQNITSYAPVFPVLLSSVAKEQNHLVV